MPALCRDVPTCQRARAAGGTVWHRLATLAEGFDTDALIRQGVMMKMREGRRTPHLGPRRVFGGGMARVRVRCSAPSERANSAGSRVCPCRSSMTPGSFVAFFRDSVRSSRFSETRVRSSHCSRDSVGSFVTLFSRLGGFVRRVFLRLGGFVRHVFANVTVRSLH